MTTAVILLAGVLGGVVFMIWLDRMIESDRVGIYLVLGIVAFDVFVDLPRFEPGGLSIDHLDLLQMVLIASLVARLLRGWRPSPMVSVTILLFMLTTFSIMRGASLFGVPAAVNEARDQLYLLSTILYASFLRIDRPTREEVARAWLWFCQILLAIAVLRWAIVLSGIPLRGAWYDEQYWGLRVVTSAEALALGQGGLILLARILRGEATQREWQLASALGAGVIILQHRSVYAVTLCGAAVMIWRHREILSRRFVMTVISSALLAAIAFVTVFDSGQLASQATTADASSTVTFEWRVQGWLVLLEDSGAQGPEDTLFGRPYGAGYDRVLPGGNTVDVSPHNHYLELLLRIGVVGLAVVLLLGFGTWARLRQAEPKLGDSLLSDSTLAVLFVTYMLFMIPYNVPMESGVLIGLSISAWAVRTPVRSQSLGPSVVPVVVEDDVDVPEPPDGDIGAAIDGAEVIDVRWSRR